MPISNCCCWNSVLLDSWTARKGNCQAIVSCDVGKGRQELMHVQVSTATAAIKKGERRERGERREWGERGKTLPTYTSGWSCLK